MDNFTATEIAYKNGYESGLDKMQSIIDVIYHQQMTDIENGICKAVLDVGINVDKERLTRAIEDARSFYAEGYEQGMKDAVKHGRWIFDDYTKRLRCSECEAYKPYEVVADYIDYWDCDYCHKCGADMRGDGK